MEFEKMNEVFQKGIKIIYDHLAFGKGDFGEALEAVNALDLVLEVYERDHEKTARDLKALRSEVANIKKNLSVRNNERGEV